MMDSTITDIVSFFDSLSFKGWEYIIYQNQITGTYRIFLIYSNHFIRVLINIEDTVDNLLSITSIGMDDKLFEITDDANYFKLSPNWTISSVINLVSRNFDFNKIKSEIERFI